MKSLPSAGLQIKGGKRARLLTLGTLTSVRAMRAPSGSALLLLCHCLLWATVAPGVGQSIWDEPIQFKTKSEDQCSMIITGQGEFTKLRISCHGGQQAYWCEYLGTPHTCRPYNKNPRHYFIQIMWNLRKQHQACQGPRLLRPHMCRKAPDEAQMAFQAASFSQWDASTATASSPATRSEPPQSFRRVYSWADPATLTTSGTESQQPSTAPAESAASRMARYYCWRSMQRSCAFVFRLFRQ